MDDDNATDTDLALSRKRGVERLTDSGKLQDAILTEGKGVTFIFCSLQVFPVLYTFDLIFMLLFS